MIGDSITVGYNASAPRDTNGYVGLMRSSLQSVYGNAGFGLYGMFRAEWAFAGEWTAYQSPGLLGIAYKSVGAGATATITIPGVDGIDVFYMTNAETAAFTVTIDGGDPVGVGGSSATLEEHSYHFDVSLGDHTVVITAPASDYMYLDGIWSSVGTSGMQVCLCGKSGATSGTAAGTGKLLWLPVLNPDLTIVVLGINDYGSQVSIANYTANITEIVTAAKAVGSVLVISTGYDGTPRAIPESSYHAAAEQVASALGVAYLDIADTWGSYADAVDSGYMGDTTHPSGTGHTSMDSIIRAVIPLIG